MHLAMALLTNVACVNNTVGRIAHVLVQPDICAAADCFWEHSPTFLQMGCNLPLTLLLKQHDCREDVFCPAEPVHINSLRAC